MAMRLGKLILEVLALYDNAMQSLQSLSLDKEAQVLYPRGE